MGGVKTDYWGQTTLAGLYAAGETASLGVHGANRLASNSLLDGLVYGHRSARAAALEIRKDKVPTLSKKELDSALKNNSRVQITDETIRQFTNRIRSIMWRNVGINRNEAGIKTAITKLHQIGNYLNFSPRTFEEAELQNLALVSRLVAKAALDRKESRGAHYRTDSPKTDDKHWKKHLCYRKSY
jgi:L-aspartate oxidase